MLIFQPAVHHKRSIVRHSGFMLEDRWSHATSLEMKPTASLQSRLPVLLPLESIAKLPEFPIGVATSTLYLHKGPTPECL